MFNDEISRSKWEMCSSIYFAQYSETQLIMNIFIYWDKNGGRDVMSIVRFQVVTRVSRRSRHFYWGC